MLHTEDITIIKLPGLSTEDILITELPLLSTGDITIDEPLPVYLLKITPWLNYLCHLLKTLTPLNYFGYLLIEDITIIEIKCRRFIVHYASLTYNSARGLSTLYRAHTIVLITGFESLGPYLGSLGSNGLFQPTFGATIA